MLEQCHFVETCTHQDHAAGSCFQHVRKILAKWSLTTGNVPFWLSECLLHLVLEDEAPKTKGRPYKQAWLSSQ
jgi:hypothetical protein